MPKSTNASINDRRANGFSIYPDSETLATIDKLATEDDRGRAPMAVVLIKEAIRARKKPTPPRRPRAEGETQ